MNEKKDPRALLAAVLTDFPLLPSLLGSAVLFTLLVLLFGK